MLKINLYDFKNAIERIEKVVPKKTKMPILETVNFKTVNESSLELCATDLEQFTTMIIPCVADEQLNINIDVTAVKKALKYFKNDVRLSVKENNTVKVTDGNKSIDITYLDGNDAPEKPIPEFENTYTADLQKFDTRINKVKISVSKEDTRPIFTGVHLNKNDMVTLDGFRISVNIDDDLFIEDPMTIPYKNLALMQKLYGSKDNFELRIEANNKYIQFKFDNITFISRLLDEEFYKYEQMLYQDDKKQVTVNTDNLQENVKYICDMKDKKSRIPMVTEFNNGNLTMSLSNDTGKYSTSMDIKNDYEFKIAFNPDFVNDALTSIEKNDVINLLLPERNTNPMLIINENHNEKYLILPMRMKD